MRGVGDSVCAGFAVAVTALFSFLGGDDVTVAAAAAMRIHEKLFRANVVEFGLYDSQYDISIICVMICCVGKPTTW